MGEQCAEMWPEGHAPGRDWTCLCGYDYFGGSAAYSRLLFDSHLSDRALDAQSAWLIYRDEYMRLHCLNRRRASSQMRRREFIAGYLAAAAPDLATAMALPSITEAQAKQLLAVADQIPFGKRIQHDHPERVEGCFRYDLSADEAAMRGDS